MIEVPVAAPRRVSNSELRTFKICRREWWLSYYRRLHIKRGDVVGPAQLGTRVHKGLHVYYEHPGPDGIEAAYALLKQIADEEMERIPERYEEIGKESEFAFTMIQGYFDWLDETGADNDIEVIAPETKLVAPSPYPGVEMIAKLDLRILQRSTGDEGFLDHKTVDNLTTPVKILHLDEQFRQYALIHLLVRLAESDGAAASYLRLTIYNMLRKVKRTAAAKPPFYARYPIYISDNQLRSFWDRLYGEISDIMRVEEQLAAGVSHRVACYPTPTRDCTWRCDFFQICDMFDDDNSDPEHLLGELYEPHDPLARYEPDADPVQEKGSA